MTDSNRRHPACKAGALPTELTALTARLSLSEVAAQARQIFPGNPCVNGAFRRRFLFDTSASVRRQSGAILLDRGLAGGRLGRQLGTRLIPLDRLGLAHKSAL